MNYLLSQHPVAIIHQIVSNYDKDEGPDPRAKIVLSTNSGTMLTFPLKNGHEFHAAFANFS